MNFAYGTIAAVGVLIAVSLGLIAADPGYLADPPVSGEDAAADAAPEVQMPITVTIPHGTSTAGCESTNECYIPHDAPANAGSMVTWSNDDSAAHTVTSGTVAAGADGVFDSGLLPPGAGFDFTFDAAGEYDYFCIVHPWMVGKITVT